MPIPILAIPPTLTISLINALYTATSLGRPCAENGVPGEAIAEAYHNFEQGATSMPPMTAAAISNQTIQESMRLLLLVRAYQVTSVPSERQRSRITGPGAPS